MQPNFKAMTITELKSYALTHRDEVEPLRELYRRRTPDDEATWFELPQNREEEQQQCQRFEQLLNQRSPIHSPSTDPYFNPENG